MFVQFTCKTFTCMAETKPVHAEKAEKDRVDERVDKIMPSVSSSNHYRSFKYCIYRVWHKKNNSPGKLKILVLLCLFAKISHFIAKTAINFEANYTESIWKKFTGNLDNFSQVSNEHFAEIYSVSTKKQSQLLLKHSIIKLQLNALIFGREI